MLFTPLVLLLLAPASAFVLPAAPAASSIRTGIPSMKKEIYTSSGPFGGYKVAGDGEGWVGDQGTSVQVTAFESGDDYLFFQGPAPKTAVQDDLGSFLSGEELEEIVANVNPLALVLPLITGAGSLAAVGSVVLSS